jgi:hypothetical protein
MAKMTELGLCFRVGYMVLKGMLFNTNKTNLDEWYEFFS